LGFHADRLLLGTHLHNAYLHALVQSGIVGVVPFLAALGLSWVLIIMVFVNRARLSTAHKHLFIQSTGILAFLSIRTTTESTGAFFGVDWLILAPTLLYLQVLNQALRQPGQVTKDLPLKGGVNRE
jgi:O-antigen ligase